MKALPTASVDGRLQLPARERPFAPAAGLDAESETWLRDLRSDGAPGEDARVRLHELWPTESLERLAALDAK